MDQKLLDLLEETKFFSDEKIKILGCDEIKDNTYKVITSEGDYEFYLFENNSYVDLYTEINHKKLSQIGANPKRTFEVGLIDSVNMSYTIKEFRDELSLKEYLKSHNKDENYKLGLEFGKVLYQLHGLKPEKEVDWYEIFKTKANYLFYMHGVGEVGDKDYILIDYIQANLHLTKYLRKGYIYKDLNQTNIYVESDGTFNLEHLDFNTVGDSIFDFTNINEIAIDNPSFAKGTFDGYFKSDKAPIKFFRLLALYQAYVILDAIVAMREGKDTNLNQDEVNSLLDMYDYFNEDVPNWT